MKLKKIASLMLAGIMAVSMLAACGEGKKDDSSSSSSGSTTASGYSAMLGQKAADTLKKNDLDKIFTFADDADDQKALEEVVRNGIVQQNVMNVVAGVSVENATNVKDPAVPALVAPFRTKIGANGGLANLNSAAASMNDTTVASLWVANGDIAMNNVMDTVFEGCKSVFAGADDEGEFGTGSYIVTLDYKYEVSVSVVNVPVKYDTTKTGSVNFIAVTVTRTAEVA